MEVGKGEREGEKERDRGGKIYEREWRGRGTGSHRKGWKGSRRETGGEGEGLRERDRGSGEEAESGGRDGRGGRGRGRERGES